MARSVSVTCQAGAALRDWSRCGRYYPPEFWDQKGFNDKANLNTFRGESWRNRGAQVNSKLLTQGRNVIRFEMPWDIICLGEKCGECVHKGVRFNADKDKAGKYFTTTIWHFRLKCHLCDNIMIMATDPEKCDYKCVSGCRRKQETWLEDEDTLKRPDKREQRRMEEDPFYRLEHFAADDGSGRREDEVRGKVAKGTIGELRELQEERAAHDGMLNRLLRKSFREEKRETARREQEDAAERTRLNLAIPLLPVSEADADAARAQTFGARLGGEDARFEAARRQQRRTIMQTPMLPQAQAGATTALQRVQARLLPPRDADPFVAQSACPRAASEDCSARAPTACDDAARYCRHWRCSAPKAAPGGSGRPGPAAGAAGSRHAPGVC